MTRRQAMISLGMTAVLSLSLLLMHCWASKPKSSEQPPSPLRELMQLSMHDPYDYKSTVHLFERAVVTARAALENGTPVSELITPIIEAAAEGKITLIWLKRWTFALHRDIDEALFELLNSKSEKVRQYVEKFLAHYWLPLPDFRERQQEEAFRVFRDYILRLRKEGKEMPEKTVELLFEVNPEFAAMVFFSVCERWRRLPPQERLEHEKEFRWSLNCIEVAVYRSKRERLQPGDIALAQKQMAWLLSHYPESWVKHYLLQALDGAPELYRKDLVEQLRKLP